MAKYTKLYLEIKSDIEKGILKPGDQLPSEKDLMDAHQVSRDTVRKSLSLLVADNYIMKVMGKGSFVLEINRFDFPVAGLISFKEMRQRMGKVSHSTEIVSIKNYENSTFPIKTMEQEEKKEISEVIRVRIVGGRKMILDKDYFYTAFVPNLTKEIAEESIYDYIENELELKIGYAHKEIIMEKATKEDYENLDLHEYNMVAVVNTLVYLQSGQLFQYTQSRHCPDKFRFTDVARRLK